MAEIGKAIVNRRGSKHVDLLLSGCRVAEKVIQYSVARLWAALITEVMRFVNDHNVGKLGRTLKCLALRLRIDVGMRHQLEVTKGILATDVR